MSESPKTTTISIGDIPYIIDISKIPYLSSFIDFQTTAQPETTKFIHGPIPLFAIALQGIQSGYRQCFRSLPPSLSECRILCDTYDFLCVDILRGQSLTELSQDLKAGQEDYDGEERRVIRGDKSKARDAAFRLLYLILLGEFEDQTKDSVRVFNAVMYVVSHAATFRWRTRKMVREAYEDRFEVSVKQRAGLERWDTDRLVVEDEDDVTTEEDELDGYYSSDYAYYTD